MEQGGFPQLKWAKQWKESQNGEQLCANDSLEHRVAPGLIFKNTQYLVHYMHINMDNTKIMI